MTLNHPDLSKFLEPVPKSVCWKNTFCSMNRQNLGVTVFLKLYTVLLRAELICTIKSSLTGWEAGASQVAAKRPMYNFKNLFPLILSSFMEQNIFYREIFFCSGFAKGEMGTSKNIDSIQSFP